MSAPEDAAKARTIGVVRTAQDPLLQYELREQDPKLNVFSPPYYTRDAEGNQVPSPPPESLSAEERRHGSRIYHQWGIQSDTAPMEGLHKRALRSLSDGRAVNGLDSSTGNVYPAVSGDPTVAAVVDATVSVHEALKAEWPDACEIVDPRLPVSVLPSLGDDEDLFEAVHSALLNDTLKYHRPVPYDPENPVHVVDRVGLIVGQPQRLYALRGAWRDYRTWARDLGLGGQYALHVSHSCALARNGFVTPRCAEHTGGEFLLIHRLRYLVVVPVCHFCKETLLRRFSTEAAQ